MGAMYGGAHNRIGCILLATVTILSGCALAPEKLPVLTGVSATPIDSHRIFGKPYSDDVKSKYLKGSVVRGPHYSLGIAWTATGDELRETAKQYDIAPGRAAQGKQLLIAAVDPKLNYAPFEPTATANVIVEVVVDGTATKLEGLPLPAEDQGREAFKTRLLVLSARPKAQVQLRVTDAGRTNSIDLRTGKPTVDAKGGYVQKQGDVNWKDEQPVVLVSQFRGIPVSGPLEVSRTFDLNAPPASLTTWLPDRGWAAPGRAFLSVPAPNLSFANGVSLLFGRLHATFDDAGVFFLQLPAGKPIPATSFRRDVTLSIAGVGSPQPGVVFLVRADTASGTVSFELFRTRLTEVLESGRRRTVPWAQAPKAFTEPLIL